MTRNAEIAAQFDEIADRMSLLGESWFKIRAYRNAAETMRSGTHDIAALSAAGTLDALDGIGEAIAQKTSDYLATGHIPLLDRLRTQIPDGRLELMRAGLAPSQVREVAERLGVESPDDLAAALPQHGDKLKPKTLTEVQKAVARFA